MGHGSHGLALAEVVRAVGEEAVFYDDQRHLGRPLELLDGSPMLIAINAPLERFAMAARLWWTVASVPMVHPDATFAGIGSLGVVVAAQAVINRGTRLGWHTHVNVGATVSQSCVIGDFVTISPGAHVCGEVKVGARTNIGAGAIVKNLVTIGEDVVIGCGAVVVNDIPDGLVVVGNPARPL